MGATYDPERLDAEAGLHLSLGQHMEGWVALRHVTGAADVSSPTGGGETNVRGMGGSLGINWNNASGFYADGYFSLTNYDIDLSSNTRGKLKSGVQGLGYAVGVEAGRRFGLSDTLNLTPRARLVHTRLSIESFTDALNARVSFPEANRLMGGIGLMAETVRSWDGGELSLRGSVDLEGTLSGGETEARVSGERLMSEAAPGSLLLGLGGVYRRGRFFFGAEASAGTALGSDSMEYAGLLTVGARF